MAGRMTLEKLVREVSRRAHDPALRTMTIGETAEEIGEHPWRVIDALDVVELLEGGSPDGRFKPQRSESRWAAAR